MQNCAEKATRNIARYDSPYPVGDLRYSSLCARPWSGHVYSTAYRHVWRPLKRAERLKSVLDGKHRFRGDVSGMLIILRGPKELSLIKRSCKLPRRERKAVVQTSGRPTPD